MAPIATLGSPPRISGLAVSPTDASSPHMLQPRPKGPGTVRPKRASWTTSGSPSPRHSPALRSSLDRESSQSRSSTPERFTGTLVERTEEELVRASRDTLQNALRREWSKNEKLAAQVDDMDTTSREHDARVAQLEAANQALQAKYDASFTAQGEMEEQMEAANDLIERLRHKAEDAERQLRLQQRRYVDQEKAFEAERTVHQAEQNHLVQRIKSLTNERIARPSDNEGDRSGATAALQEELVTLSASHQTLVAQLTTLADELHEIKAENTRLQDENDSWQLLIEERTLAGHMRGGLIPEASSSPPPGDGTLTPSSIRRKEPSALETLEEQLEMDELHAELDEQQPIFDESDRALLRVNSGGSYNVDLSSPTRVNGNSLAAELGGGISLHEVENLRSEIKTLKEGNKALSLYCSKILDRIIASEGFEHILSVDYRTRRGTRGLSNGKLAPARPSVLELAKDMEENGPPPIPEARPALPPNEEAAKEPEAPARKARPQSMFIAPSPALAAPTPIAPKPTVPGAPVLAKDSAADKRARRGFSIDFRSLGFGGAQEKPETKPQLKPLQLASRAAPAGQSPPKTTSSPIVALGPSSAANINPPVPGARKLAPQEEDEEDRRERSRMEANLKLMGITSPPSESPQEEKEKPTSAASAAAGWLSRRLSRANTTPQPAASPTLSATSTTDPEKRSSGTPLTRLSAALSDSTSAHRLELSGQDPEAALRAYDAREKEQARLLAEGKNQTAFTVPPKIGSRRTRSSVGSTSNTSRNSGQSFASASPASATSGGGVETIDEIRASGTGTTGKGHRGRESISTLWSIGSSHE